MDSEDIRDRRVAKYLLQGKSNVDACRLAGFSESTAATQSTRIISRPGVQSRLVDAMHAAGITTEAIAEKLRQGMDAEETKFFQKDGQVTDSRNVIAWSERRQMLELVTKLRGDLVDASVNVNVVLDHIPAELEAEMILTPGEMIDLEAEIVTPQDVETATSSGSGGAKEPPTHPVIAPEMGT